MLSLCAHAFAETRAVDSRRTSALLRRNTGLMLMAMTPIVAGIFVGFGFLARYKPDQVGSIEAGAMLTVGATLYADGERELHRMQSQSTAGTTEIFCARL